MNTPQSNSSVEKAYQLAREHYASLKVDTDQAMETLSTVAVSLHCWQGDDVSGFETGDGISDGGIQATGNYPGKARNADELRCDLEMAYRMIPGSHRLNLHAIYAETGGKKVERNQICSEHFSSWLDWAKKQGLGLDFNPSCFSHPLAKSGFTLASLDPSIRQFWIEHCMACRKIGQYFGKNLGTSSVTNIWIPDGYKDIPVNRKIHRELLCNSLDEIFTEEIDSKHNLDSIEGKLFGIGSESYVVGSHEFYLGYAISRKKLLCLDAGHFHPTEYISDKISSVMLYLDEILLHVSRGVRWDSDHVVILNDDLRGIAEEIIRGDYLKRIHIGLDFFDASINRVAAWVIGTRSMIKALLLALLEPIEQLRSMEQEGDFTARLALLEELKTMPFGAVWNYYCLKNDVPVGFSWLREIKTYEKNVLSKRG